MTATYRIHGYLRVIQQNPALIIEYPSHVQVFMELDHDPSQDFAGTALLQSADVTVSVGTHGGNHPVTLPSGPAVPSPRMLLVFNVPAGNAASFIGVPANTPHVPPSTVQPPGRRYVDGYTLTEVTVPDGDRGVSFSATGVIPFAPGDVAGASVIDIYSESDPADPPTEL